MAALEARLQRELQSGQMTRAQTDDVRQQRALFEARRDELQRLHHGRVVCFVADELMVGDSVPEIVERAKARYPGRMFYAETIGFDMLGGVAQLREDVKP